MKTLVSVLFACAGIAATVQVQAQAIPDLAKSKNCLGCHSVDKKVVGPAFHDVAAKYGGQKDAQAKLVASINKGSTGTWGAMAMPPNAVSQDEAATLAKWVLSLK